MRATPASQAFASHAEERVAAVDVAELPARLTQLTDADTSALLGCVREAALKALRCALDGATRPDLCDVLAQKFDKAKLLPKVRARRHHEPC